MGWELSFMFVFGLFGIVIIYVNIEESIKNYKENKILDKRYRKQKYYTTNLDKCPKCGYPVPPFNRITKEGYWEAFIPNMYCVDKFDCFNNDCNFKVEVIRKWDKQKWCYE